MSSLEELRNRKSQLEEKISIIENKENFELIDALEDLSVEEKAERFDLMYELARDNLEYVMEHGCDRKDTRYWSWDTLMRQTLGSRIFEVLNKYYK